MMRPVVSTRKPGDEAHPGKPAAHNSGLNRARKKKSALLSECLPFELSAQVLLNGIEVVTVLALRNLKGRAMFRGGGGVGCMQTCIGIL